MSPQDSAPSREPAELPMLVGRAAATAQLVETLQLFLDPGRATLVGAGEVRHHVAYVQRIEVCAVLEQLPQLLATEAQAGHAGVDVQHGRQRPPFAARARRPVGALAGCDQHRHQAVHAKGVRAERRDALEHVDIRVGQQGAQGDAFAVGRGEKLAAAGAEQRRSDAREAEAVGVGLDDRGTAGRGDPVPAVVVIGRERVEVDGDEGAHVRVRLVLAQVAALRPPPSPT
jgi:hypothetical protein